MKRKVLTAKGRKIRKTRRLNQIKKRVANMNVGDNDKATLVQLLSTDLTTKKGVARSKRLEQLLLDKGDAKALSRFKEFKQIKHINGFENLSKGELIKSIGRHDYEFYKENRNLILDYNEVYKDYKGQHGAGFANRKHENYNRQAALELNREQVAQQMEVKLSEFKRKVLNRTSPFAK